MGASVGVTAFYALTKDDSIRSKMRNQLSYLVDIHVIIKERTLAPMSLVGSCNYSI